MDNHDKTSHIFAPPGQFFPSQTVSEAQSMSGVRQYNAMHQHQGQNPYGVQPSKRPTPSSQQGPLPLGNGVMSFGAPGENRAALTAQVQDLMTQLHNVMSRLQISNNMGHGGMNGGNSVASSHAMSGIDDVWGTPPTYTSSAAPPQLTNADPLTIALVEFKRQRVRRYESNISISPGQYVIVEGDRGIDCGLIVHTWVTTPDGATQHSCIDGVNVDMTRVRSDSGRMLRVATQAEVSQLHGEICALEVHALQTCKEKCLELGMDIKLLDCEFQFDRKKITFYFDSSTAVDFRVLVRDLFKTFGARIWMENVNSKVRNTAPPGALNSHEKNAAMGRGHHGRPGMNANARGNIVTTMVPHAPPAPPSNGRGGHRSENHL